MNRFKLSNSLFYCILYLMCPLNGSTLEADLSPFTIDYREEMRKFVQTISAYAKGINPSFLIIPQNGHELLTKNGEPDGKLARNYIHAIDGIGRENLFYGYEADNIPTPANERDWMIHFMNLAETNNVEVLVTDYCSTRSFVDDSYQQNNSRNYISFAADHRELNTIPIYPSRLYLVNDNDIQTLSEAKNFLYLINPNVFPTKNDFFASLQETNYDLIIIDAFWETETLEHLEIESLKTKANGGKRLIIAYMSIGEAENYRFYWKKEWAAEPPAWLASENPNWVGNFKVRYWHQEWQNIIWGTEDSYLGKIVNTGFDGVYLDIIDAFEYFEEQTAVLYWLRK